MVLNRSGKNIHSCEPSFARSWVHGGSKEYCRSNSIVFKMSHSISHYLLLLLVNNIFWFDLVLPLPPTATLYYARGYTSPYKQTLAISYATDAMSFLDAAIHLSTNNYNQCCKTKTSPCRTLKATKNTVLHSLPVTPLEFPITKEFELFPVIVRRHRFLQPTHCFLNISLNVMNSCHKIQDKRSLLNNHQWLISEDWQRESCSQQFQNIKLPLDATCIMNLLWICIGRRLLCQYLSYVLRMSSIFQLLRDAYSKSHQQFKSSFKIKWQCHVIFTYLRRKSVQWKRLATSTSRAALSRLSEALALDLTSYIHIPTK